MKFVYSVEEFLTAYGLSRTLFYSLIKKKQAPKMMHVGRRRLISIEAAEEWRKKMENSPPPIKKIKNTHGLKIINTDCFLED